MVEFGRRGYAKVAVGVFILFVIFLLEMNCTGAFSRGGFLANGDVKCVTGDYIVANKSWLAKSGEEWYMNYCNRDPFDSVNGTMIYAIWNGELNGKAYVFVQDKVLYEVFNQYNGKEVTGAELKYGVLEELNQFGVIINADEINEITESNLNDVYVIKSSDNRKEVMIVRKVEE